MATRRVHDVPGTAVAAGFASLAAYLLTESQDMTAMGSVFPTTISAAMLVFSLVLIVRNVLAARPLAAAPDGMGSESTSRRLGFMVAMAGWIVLLPIVGFYVSSLLGFLVILILASHEPARPKTWAVLILFGVAVVTGFYLLMARVLLIPLPRGWLL